jgi:hypothetical protein
MPQTHLITVAVGEYQHEPNWNLAEATDSAHQVAAALQSHGVLRLDWSQRATKSEYLAVLEDLAGRIDSANIIYWVGHAEVSDTGYYAALSDSKGPLTSRNALPHTAWPDVLRDYSDQSAFNGTHDGWTLLILDTCGSAHGAEKIWEALHPKPERVGIIATSDDGAAFAGHFPTVLASVLENFSGEDANGIKVLELSRRLEAALRDRGSMQKVFARDLDAARLPPPEMAPPDVRAPVEVYAELQRVMEQAPAQVRNHFYAKAQGAELGELAWHFTGREVERELVCEWLTEADRGIFVVTGVAGSGKSALLGMLLATSDAQVYAAIVAAGQEPIADERPPVGFDAVVHLSGRTLTETVRDIARQLLTVDPNSSGPGAAVEPDREAGTNPGMNKAMRGGMYEGLDRGALDVSSPDDLIEHLQRNPAAVRQRTLLVDALDESRDAMTIAAFLPRLSALPGMRVLVGTRQSLHEELDTAAAPDRALLEQLGVNEEHTLVLPHEMSAINHYVSRRLRSAKVAEERATKIARRIARRQEPFLFARLAAYEVIADPRYGDDEQALRELLSGGHSGIFNTTIQRLRAVDPRIEALLHALAYARGSGFPRTDGIWARAAGVFVDETMAIEDTLVQATLDLAAPYIMQDSEFGQTTYRLAHRTFREAYRRNDS